jgi:hypothetical protein
MIVVRVELHSAITHKVTELARLYISNIGGTRTSGDYEVEILRGRSTKDLDKRIAQRKARVLGHSRLSEHVWNLVEKALRAAGYGDHKHSRDERKRKEHACPKGDGPLPE